MKWAIFAYLAFLVLFYKCIFCKSATCFCNSATPNFCELFLYEVILHENLHIHIKIYKNIMKKEQEMMVYEAPQVEVIEVEVEKGFATSTESTLSDFGCGGDLS